MLSAMKNFTLNSTLILMLGDAVIFGFFAIGGRETHAAGDTNLIVNALPTLLTFLLIWIAVARLIGVWRAEVIAYPRRALARTLIAWAVAGPIGLVARAVILSRTAIPLPFILVTLGLNGSLLLLWHGGYAGWRARQMV